MNYDLRENVRTNRNEELKNLSNNNDENNLIVISSDDETAHNKNEIDFKTEHAQTIEPIPFAKRSLKVNTIICNNKIYINKMIDFIGDTMIIPINLDRTCADDIQQNTKIDISKIFNAQLCVLDHFYNYLSFSYEFERDCSEIPNNTDHDNPISKNNNIIPISADNPSFNPINTNNPISLKIGLVMGINYEKLRVFFRDYFKDNLKYFNTLTNNDRIFILYNYSRFDKPLTRNTICARVLDKTDLVLNYTIDTDKIIQITTSDILSLQENFINDTIIDFYLNYLKIEILHVEHKHTVRMFSSFLYRKILKGLTNGFNDMKNWVKDIKLQYYKYLFIPIAEHVHWFLFLVIQPVFDAHAQNAKINILVFDSLNHYNSNNNICNVLKNFIEWYYKNLGDFNFEFEFHAPISRRQPNFRDCGAYLMANAEGIIREINERGIFRCRKDCSYLIDGEEIKTKRIQITRLIIDKAYNCS